MKVKYLKDVSAPSYLAGKTGDIKEIELHIARPLIETGYIEEIKGGKSADKKTDTAIK